jgi:hypothetical protein
MDPWHSEPLPTFFPRESRCLYAGRTGGAFPFGRLTSLLVAIFFLFGMVGCFVDLLDYGRKPWVPVFVWSVFSGFIAVVWIIAYFRDLRWLIGAVVLWVVGRVLSPSSCQVSARIRSPAPNSVPQSQRSLA